MEMPITIDQSTCRACGLCGEICPNHILRKNNQAGISLHLDRVSLCIACGQCMAICPTRSITVAGLKYGRDFFELPDKPVMEMPFLEMIETRRAIRVFKNKPVPKEILEKIVQAIAFAPPGFPPIKTEIVVIQNTAVIRQALPEMIKFYERLIQAVNHPLARRLVRRKVGNERFTTLTQHVVPMMKKRLPALKDGSEDTITRSAPALILFHAAPDAENYTEDIHIALTYGFLAAHALGLGGSAMTLIPPAIQNSPALRKLFSIPDGNIVTGALILGYPKYRYQRGIHRPLKRITWI